MEKGRTPVGSPGPRCRNGRRWPLPVRVRTRGWFSRSKERLVEHAHHRTAALAGVASAATAGECRAERVGRGVLLRDGEAAGHVEHHQARTGTAGRSGLYLGCGAHLPQDRGDLDGRGPGMTPREVANQLGHERAGMTMDRYMFRKTVRARAARIP